MDTFYAEYNKTNTDTFYADIINACIEAQHSDTGTAVFVLNENLLHSVKNKFINMTDYLNGSIKYLEKYNCTMQLVTEQTMSPKVLVTYNG